MTGKSRKVIEINRVFFQENMKKKKTVDCDFHGFLYRRATERYVSAKAGRWFVGGKGAISSALLDFRFRISDYVGQGQKKE